MSEARKLNDEELQEEQLEEVACLDDSSAEYLLGRIREANEQFDKLEAWYALQLGKAMAVRDRTIAWAERGLKAYLEMIPAANRTKTQISYELPGGKLLLKAQAPEYERDEAALVPWMKKNGMTELVKVKESANWAELKKTLKEGPDGTMVTGDGEIVPGIKVIQREPKFTATPTDKRKV